MVAVLYCLSFAAVLIAPTTRAAEAESELAYETVISVPEAPALKDLMEASSLLLRLRESPLRSRRALGRRIDADATRFERILRSEGYYAGRIRHETSWSAPARVSFTIEVGGPYLLGEFDVVRRNCRGAECAPSPSEADLGLRFGQRARAADLVAARKLARRWFEERGHPFPEAGALAATVDHASRGVFVELTVETGQPRRWGEPKFKGAEAVRESYLRRLLTWRPGDLYDRRLIESYRRRLRETGLFSSIAVEPVAGGDDAEPLAIEVRLVAAKPRSIGAGVAFSTSEGPSGRVFWEHRNFLGADEDFRLTGSGSPLRQALEFDFRKPAFIHADHGLALALAAEREDKDSFDQLGLSGEVDVERRPTPEITTSLGVSAEIAEITDQDGTRLSRLLGLPIGFARDTRKDLLDPRGGFRYALGATPFIGFLDGPVAFARLEASGAYYHELAAEGRLVLALRGRIGALPGPDTDTIPATRRFYGGGGGSIRGYEFELVGPLDGGNDPLGGRSVLELGAEIRARAFGDFGVVGFIEGGNVYDAPYPSFEREIRWAAGIGLRYFTAVGPLRLDVAVPLNPRSVDEAFQFYISLGQAF